MKNAMLILFVFVSSFLDGQQTNYFNKIYDPLGTPMVGRGIVASNEGYICISGTEDPATGYQSFLFVKLDLDGGIIGQKPYSIPGHVLYPASVGGYLKRTYDGNLAFTYQAQGGGQTYSSLVKLDDQLDTLWKKDYTTELEWTLAINWNQTSDNGFILSGNALPQNEPYYDFLLIKTDSLGNEQWHQTYGTDWSEHGQNAIQTPDGGYLIGGLFWKPGTDHSLDAMVVKTDSLGNEQWTKYFGNPDIDDDMAFVQMAGDGNYLVATVYGEYIVTDEARGGRFTIYKIDGDGNTIWMKKYNPLRRMLYIKNFKRTDDLYLATGWSDIDTISLFNTGGWLYKLNNGLDSVFRHEYQYFNEADDRNSLYDATPTSDNGYIAIGSANVGFTQSNMWVLKVDSMGCDTPGCATGTWVRQISPSGGGQGEDLRIFPNPVTDRFKVSGFKAKGSGNGTIRIYDLQGIKVEEIKIPENTESTEVDVSAYPKGLYYLQYVSSGEIRKTSKFIKE